jgi:ubiquinol-cytochrome c reductase iron-sulfur subunit
VSEKDPAEGVPPPVQPDLTPPERAETRRERDDRVDRAYAAAAEQEEQQLEDVRRRPAEPPPTVEREVTSTAAMEWLTVAALLAAALAAAGFIVFYVVLPDNQLLGLTLGLALVFLAVAVIVVGKRLVPQEKAAEDYHWFGDEETQEDVVAIGAEAAEGISRRKLIAAAGTTAGITVGAAVAFPLASIGPSVGQKIYETPWRRGLRVVKENGEPLLAAEVTDGTFFTAFPEGADRAHLGAPLIVIRVPPERLQLKPGREDSAPDGVIAFSKICPHAGCAVSMFRKPKYPPNEPQEALVCPCHYSTFDPVRGGRLLFGPAGRDLPQLPLSVDADGALVAAGDFFDTIGPSYGGSRIDEPGSSS